MRHHSAEDNFEWLKQFGPRETTCRTHVLTPMYLETHHVHASSMTSAIILLKLVNTVDRGSSLS